MVDGRAVKPAGGGYAGMSPKGLTEERRIICNHRGGFADMIFRIIGTVVVLFGLVLPGAKYNRRERYKDAKSFFQWVLWFVLGIAIMFAGLFIISLGGK